MESCDVGLLPSYAETYGYFVLEAQSRGCPVITTDVRAFPEINPPAVGWTIPVPKRANGEARYHEPGGKLEISKRIREGLTSIISTIVEDSRLARTKGEAARARIKREHCPDEYASRLGALYRAAVGA